MSFDFDPGRLFILETGAPQPPACDCDYCNEKFSRFVMAEDRHARPIAEVSRLTAVLALLKRIWLTRGAEGTRN